ncbi:hypothetical protein KUTeg_024458 [Tegillarca granosa]|uniref:Uncharacterized protein n=1 Tax=Tegillarca granosa TaxID=220873 RepID=A0ABQ9E2X2_TEGGR|nr:hypothetical protein KUTeg_024458 [Tegillarca granosa]
MNIKTVKVTDVNQTVENAQSNNHSTSCKDVTKQCGYDYLNSTTLHCVCHLGNTDYIWWRRIVWILVFVTMVIVFVLNSFELMTRYLSYNIVTKEVSLYEDEPEFPAITICNLNKIDNDTVTEPENERLLKETYSTIMTNMSYFNSLSSTFLNSVNLSYYFHTRTKLDKTALLCTWQTENIPCGDYFLPVMTNFGKCLSFNSKTFVKTNGEALRMFGTGSEEGLSVSLNAYQEDYLIGSSAAAGFKVVVHEPNEEPPVKEVGLAISPGTSTQFAVKKIELSFPQLTGFIQKRYLPSPVKAFGERYCLDTTANGFVNPLKYTDYYSLHACLAECEVEYTVKMCGCRDVLQLANIPRQVQFSSIFIQHLASTNYSRNVSCPCTRPCREIEYSVQISSAWYPRDNFVDTLLPASSYNIEYFRYLEEYVELRVYFESKLYIQQTQVLELSSGDIYAAIGGFMGLCFGASVGTVFEIFEFLVHLVVPIGKGLQDFSPFGISFENCSSLTNKYTGDNVPVSHMKYKHEFNRGDNVPVSHMKGDNVPVSHMKYEHEFNRGDKVTVSHMKYEHEFNRGDNVTVSHMKGDNVPVSHMKYEHELNRGDNVTVSHMKYEHEFNRGDNVPVSHMKGDNVTVSQMKYEHELNRGDNVPVSHMKGDNVPVSHMKYLHEFNRGDNVPVSHMKGDNVTVSHMKYEHEFNRGDNITVSHMKGDNVPVSHMKYEHEFNRGDNRYLTLPIIT